MFPRRGKTKRGTSGGGSGGGQTRPTTLQVTAPHPPGIGGTLTQIKTAIGGVVHTLGGLLTKGFEEGGIEQALFQESNEQSSIGPITAIVSSLRATASITGSPATIAEIRKAGIAADQNVNAALLQEDNNRLKEEIEKLKRERKE